MSFSCYSLFMQISCCFLRILYCYWVLRMMWRVYVLILWYQLWTLVSFYPYYSQFWTTLSILSCSQVTFNNPSLYFSTYLSCRCNFMTKFYLSVTTRLLNTESSCLLATNILFFSSMISSCCFFIYNFLSLIISSSSSITFNPNFFFFDLSFYNISSNCLANSQIWAFSLMFC